MSKNQQITKMVKPWADKIGIGTALGRLVNRGVNIRMAEELISGQYDKEPRDITALVLKEELAKDGFHLSGNEVA